MHHRLPSHAEVSTFVDWQFGLIQVHGKKYWSSKSRLRRMHNLFLHLPIRRKEVALNGFRGCYLVHGEVLIDMFLDYWAIALDITYVHRILSMWSSPSIFQLAYARFRSYFAGDIFTISMAALEAAMENYVMRYIVFSSGENAHYDGGWDPVFQCLLKDGADLHCIAGCSFSEHQVGQTHTSLLRIVENSWWVYDSLGPATDLLMWNWLCLLWRCGINVVEYLSRERTILWCQCVDPSVRDWLGEACCRHMKLFSHDHSKVLGFLDEPYVSPEGKAYEVLQEFRLWGRLIVDYEKFNLEPGMHDADRDDRYHRDKCKRCTLMRLRHDRFDRRMEKKRRKGQARAAVIRENIMPGSWID